MGTRAFCNECSSTIYEGYRRKAHLSLDRYVAADDVDTEEDPPSLDFCNVACLKAYLDAGKPL